MKKNKSGAIILGILLVIIALAGGVGIGFVMGRSTAKTAESEGSGQSGTVSNTVIETNGGTNDAAQVDTESTADVQETSAQTAEVDPDDSVVVLSVDGSDVTLNEINVRLYSLRNYYVGNYGEDPWGQTTDGGQTVAEEAKQTLENDIIRAEVCMSKAADYGVMVTDEISANCLDDAQTTLDNLGQDIADEFGLTLAAQQSVNIKYEVVTAVTNALSDQVREELLADEANQSLSDEELELKISEQVQQEMNSWIDSAQVEYSDVWAQIVVGSVG